MLFAIAVLTFVTMLLFLYILFISQTRQYQLEQRFKTAGIVPVDYISDELRQPLYYRLFRPVAKGFGGISHGLTIKGLQRILAGKLKEAGLVHIVAVRQFVLRQILAVLFLVGSSLGVSCLAGKGLKTVLLNMLYAVLAGCFWRWLVLRRKIAERKNNIQRLLPDVIDLLLISIQAGASFDSAVQRVTQQMTGVFIDELSIMLQQIRLGVSRYEALHNLADRCQTADVSLLVSALAQADRLGVSISHILEVQSQMLRKKRVLRAREMAMKAPVKLIFPLVIFLLPVLFIAILAPIAVRLMKAF